MLQSWPGARTSGKSDATGEDAAQPNIDPALLERMYSDLACTLKAAMSLEAVAASASRGLLR